jgi:hypothetical protein
VLAVKIDEMTRFWDKRLSPQAQAASRFFTWVEGTCIRRHLGRQSLKMYDRGGRILRIEARRPRSVWSRSRMVSSGATVVFPRRNHDLL